MTAEVKYRPTCEVDFYAWTRNQANHLRSRDLVPSPSIRFWAPTTGSPNPEPPIRKAEVIRRIEARADEPAVRQDRPRAARCAGGRYRV